MYSLSCSLRLSSSPSSSLLPFCLLPPLAHLSTSSLILSFSHSLFLTLIFNFSFTQAGVLSFSLYISSPSIYLLARCLQSVATPPSILSPV